MKIEYGKTLSERENTAVACVAAETGLLFDTARVLFYRGIDTPEKALKFLKPSKRNFANPFLLSGMSDAVERITYAENHGESVLIFGDYDADGVSATAVLKNCLEKFGLSPRFTVPEREEGYGLNLEKIKKMNDESPVNLLITVDCGISDAETVEKIKELGIDVIVTDHHEPPVVLPDCVCINPKIAGQKYPFNGLCGAGVAYKLGYALIGAAADEQLDLVALATVADSMDLIDENRDIVFEGLKIFNSSKIRPALKNLLSGGTKKITAQTLAFQIAPRVNAGGRMGDALSAIKLFTSTDKNEIFDLSVKLNEYNISRQTECDVLYKEARAIISEKRLYNDPAILVYDEKWKTGFIGIVAARLVEDFSRPVIVFAGADGFLKGSARSYGEVNIYEAISAAAEFTKGFGGHAQAAGVSVEKEKFGEFKARVCEYVSARGVTDAEKTERVCWRITEPFTVRFAKELELLEPYGCANPKPLFTVRTESADFKPLKKGSPHYSFKTEYIEILDFNGENDLPAMTLPAVKEVVFEPNYSTFNGRESVKGFFKFAVIGEAGEKADLCAFRRQVISLKNDFSSVGVTDEKINAGYGTLYAACGEVEKSLLPEGVKSYRANSAERAGKNCLVVAPEKVAEDYNRVVYVHLPLSAVCTEKPVFVLAAATPPNFAARLDLSRSAFAEVYSEMISLCGTEFCDSVRLYEKSGKNVDEYEFVLAAEVFTELGFFYNDRGIMRKDPLVKKPLESSVIYSKTENYLSKIYRGEKR